MSDLWSFRTLWGVSDRIPTQAAIGQKEEHYWPTEGKFGPGSDLRRGWLQRLGVGRTRRSPSCFLCLPLWSGGLRPCQQQDEDGQRPLSPVLSATPPVQNVSRPFQIRISPAPTESHAWP